MRKQTDINNVKAMAKRLLYTDVHQTDYSPMIVQHPFTNTGIVMIRGTNEFLDITASKDNLHRWQKLIKQEIDETENLYKIYALINKPYCLTFLKFLKPYLSKQDFSLILADAWIKSENPNCDPDVSKRELVAMFKSADKTNLMTSEELEHLSELDDEVTIYRGVTSVNAKNIKALSWTLDYDKALWFAHRFGEQGTVYEARIRKENILALFDGRNESEIVVEPKYLEQIQEAEDISQVIDLNQN